MSIAIEVQHDSLPVEDDTPFVGPVDLAIEISIYILSVDSGWKLATVQVASIDNNQDTTRKTLALSSSCVIELEVA